MARQNGFRYEISWEKDESDANLEYDKLTAYVPGVTHLGKKNQKPLKSKPHKSTQSSSKHPKGPTMTTKVGDNVKGQEVSKGEDTVSLKNLRPQDKKRIANLIKELAKVGEEKEVAMQQLTVERKEFEVRYIDLQTQMNSLKTERESLQQQYLQCQKLLLECQKRLGREQAKHQQYLKSGKGREKEPLHNKSLPGERKLQNYYFEPEVQDRTKEQFKPQMQSTARVLKGPESFTNPVNNHNLPTNQQKAVHQTMNNHNMSSNHDAQHGYPTNLDRRLSPGKRDPHQGVARVAQQYQEPGSRTGNIPSKESNANPLSPSVFSLDEFHPLPEELINTKSFEGVETGHFRSPSVVRGDCEPVRLQTQTGGPSLRRFNNRSDDQGTSRYVKDERHHPSSEESRHKREYVHEEIEGDDTSYGHQRGHPTDFNSANQQHPQYETENSEWVGRGREGQSSRRSFHLDSKEDSLQRKGPISEMMVQRQRQLEEQKMLLKREQDWLQKQLRDQEELLYQKQMELEAHRDSLLVEEDHLHMGYHKVGGTSKGQGRTFHDRSDRRQNAAMDRDKYNTVSVGSDLENTTMRGEKIPHRSLSRGEPGPNSHRKNFQQHVKEGEDITLDRVGSRDRVLIHGSVSLHEDSHHRRYPSGLPANTTVDASTSPLQAPHQQIEKRSVGLSPAIHHPHSHLLEESSADASPVWSPDKKFPIMTDHIVEAIPVKDSHFLDDLIEELNSLPSESSNGPDTIIHPATPIRTLPDNNRSGLTSFHKPQHKAITSSTSNSNRLYGSEIVSSTDEEEESQLLDDIFFLN